MPEHCTPTPLGSGEAADVTCSLFSTRSVHNSRRGFALAEPGSERRIEVTLQEPSREGQSRESWDMQRCGVSRVGCVHGGTLWGQACPPPGQWWVGTLQESMAGVGAGWLTAEWAAEEQVGRVAGRQGEVLESTEVLSQNSSTLPL